MVSHGVYHPLGIAAKQCGVQVSPDQERPFFAIGVTSAV